MFGVDPLALALAVLAAGYVAVNPLLLTVGAPAFLVAENLAYAVAYAALLPGVARGSPRALAAAGALAMFNAGRVSRTVVTPSGQPGPLALEHVPLLALLLLVGALALLRLAAVKGAGGGCRPGR